MISENINLVRKLIHRKCKDCNRDPSEVKLIAVSKNFGVEKIEEAYSEGLREFGENRAQELNLKFDNLGNKIVWHFIGRLQKNKAKYVVKTADYIHSIDSLQLAEEVNKRAGNINKVQKVLVEVKTSVEQSKAGVENESNVFKISEFCSDAENLELLGLMTIAPLTDDEKLIRQSFSYLRNLRGRLNDSGFEKIKELSMGMTSDFETAIEEGATMLRIGSAIFGERNYSKDWKEI